MSSVLIISLAVVGLAQFEEKSRQVTAAVIAIALVGLRISCFSASSLRATPEPWWGYMLEEARALFVAKTQRVDVVLRFSRRPATE